MNAPSRRVETTQRWRMCFPAQSKARCVACKGGQGLAVGGVGGGEVRTASVRNGTLTDLWRALSLKALSPGSSGDVVGVAPGLGFIRPASSDRLSLESRKQRLESGATLGERAPWRQALL